MYQKTTLPLHASPSEATVHGPPSAKLRNLTIDDIESDSISKIAAKHYGTKVKWDPKVVENIVESELAPTNYDPKKLMLLEYTQYLEKVYHLSSRSDCQQMHRSTEHIFSIFFSIFGPILIPKPHR